MRTSKKLLLAAGVFAACVALPGGVAMAQEKKEEAKPPTGIDLAFDRRKGNCLACHEFPGVQRATSLTSKDYTAASVGPPLLAIKKRFPDKADLRAQIYDSTVKNPNTVMPPFGKHKILSDEEIDLITEFVHGL